MEYLEAPYEEVLYTDPNAWYGKDNMSFNHPFANLPYLKDGNNVSFVHLCRLFSNLMQFITMLHTNSIDKIYLEKMENNKHKLL